MMNSKVTTKQELINILLANRQQLLRYGVMRLGVFGSFLRDQAVDNSDVDFLIEFYPQQKNFDNFMDLAFFLQNLLGRKVEIVTPQSLSKYIGPYILNEVEYVPLAA